MKLLLLLLIFIITSFSKVITFEEALDLTLTKNKNLKAKELEINLSKTKVDNISSQNYGVFSFKETFMKTDHAGYVLNTKLGSRSLISTDMMINRMNNPDSKNNFETKLTYDLPIFTGFKLQNAKEILKLQVRANKFKFIHDKKEMTLEVLRAYNGAVASKAYVQAVKKAKLATNAYVLYASELFKEGLVTKIDVKQAQVHNYNTNAKLKEAKNRLNLSLAYLNFLTSSENISDVKDFKELKNINKTLNKLQEIAIKNRDDFKYINTNTKALRKNIKLEKSKYYPNIGAHLEYGFNEEEISLDKEKDFYIASVALEYKLYDPSRSSSIQGSKIKYNQLKYQEEYMKDAIKLEVKKAVLNLQAKQEIQVEKQKAQELAKEVLVQSQEMYKNHLINMTNLLTQQAQEQKASAEAIFSKYEAILASGILKISMGQTLKE